MKIRIELTDDSGRHFEGEVALVQTGKPPTSAPGKKAVTKMAAATTEINFGTPIRPFLKAHTKGRSGAAKFALVVAHLSKGKCDVAVKMVAIEQVWSKATSHLGKFNRAHSTRAKDEGWVDSPKKGEYTLLANWAGALAS